MLNAQKSKMKYQKDRPNAGSIESLKNRWADNDVTPYQFFLKYFTKYSKKGYWDFLLDINYYEQETTAIQKAIADFWRESK